MGGNSLARQNTRLFEPLRAWFIVKYGIQSCPWLSMMPCPASSYTIHVGAKFGRDASQGLARLLEEVVLHRIYRQTLVQNGGILTLIGNVERGIDSTKHKGL